MSAAALSLPSSPWRRTAAGGPALASHLLCLLIISMAILAYWAETPWLIAINLLPALWLAFRSPHVLVVLLLLITPTLPVLRVVDETLGSRQVSARGLFLAADDPVIVALGLAWLWRLASRSGNLRVVFPGAMLGLAALYPLVIAANLTRLEWQQSLLSFLYYLKWCEYAALLFLIPALVRPNRVGDLLRGFRLALSFGAVASAAFAVYEVSESLRTHTYSQAALFPRASAFFGSLDPLRFGASEDPVNFGCYLVVAGAISFAFSTRARTAAGGTLAAAASTLGVLLSVSRAPILAAGLAYFRMQKLRAGKTVLLLIAFAAASSSAVLLFPDAAQTVFDRFRMVVPVTDAMEGSASDRLRIVLNSPVFEIDAYWLVGHGYSSYRFIAEQHLSSFMGRFSRSLYNFPMTVWYDAGLFGIILWTALYFQLSHCFRRIASRAADPTLAALAEGLRGALVGLLVASMFSEVPYNWRVMGFFYNAAGVCLAASSRYLSPPGRLRSAL